MSSQKKPPKPLRKDNITAKVIREKIWEPPNIKNNWCVFVFVGPEGSGKSLTTVSILEKADPTFSADRVHFDPADFVRQVNSIPEEERQGKAVMMDESGVGMGSRTWFDDGQVAFNKMMQTARDDNMIVGLTLPVLDELDSQFRNRLHGFCEMWNLKREEYAKWSWKNYEVSRDEYSGVYKKYPKLRWNGRIRKIKRLKIGPPSEELRKNYEAKKQEFKDELYEETEEHLSEMDEEEEGYDPEEVVDELEARDAVQGYIDEANGQRYINRELLKADYGLTESESKTAKALLVRRFDLNVM